MINNDYLTYDIRGLFIKARRIGGMISAAAMTFILSACSGQTDSHEGHENHDHERHEHQPTAEATGHDDEGLIVLDNNQIEKLGVEATVIQPGEFSDILKVSGEISALPGSTGAVAARQAGIVKFAPGISAGSPVSSGRVIATVTARGMSGGDPNEAARVAYQAAKRELDRITPLHKEGIISTRDYNAALQRVDEARVAIGSAASAGGSAATAPVGGVLTSLDVVDGQFVEAGQTIATISSNKALTLRADLPESSASRLPAISGARFRPTYSDEVVDVIESGGKMVSTPTLSTANGGYIPVYFTLPQGIEGMINGSYCEVYLLGASRHGVIAVPEDGISEQQGKYFVYVEKEPGHYEKRPVITGPTDGNRREILSGVHPGDKVVTKGMSFVKLAETSGAVPEGHSHSH